MRLAELVGTLSMATDAGVGMPDFHALRGAIVATRLAEFVKADATTVRDAYYLPLVLAAADVYQALREERPHRRVFDADQAATELTSLVRSGVLCSDAATAVLAAAGHAVRAAERPSGLTDREVEVLRLVARGLTNKEIATTLNISTKTAGHHVQHMLEKLGVTTRAAATMVAMKTGVAQA